MESVGNKFVAVLICMLLFIFGCGQNQQESGAITSKQGGVLYFGVETDFVGFDVLGTVSGGVLIPSMANLANLIMEPLFRIDRDGSLIPVLGLSASPSKKGDFWDIALRKGVVFHDGAAFNADAVVSHWNRMLDPQNKYRGRKLFEPIRDVEKIDEHMVRFALAHPWPAFMKVISDELYLGSYIPSPKAVEAGAHDRKPVGTGPFRYGKWNSGDHYVVYRNERYWKPGQPLLNKVVFRAIPDHQTRYASLLAGQLDMISIDRGAQVNQSKQDPSLYVYASEGNGAEIVMINNLKPPLNDVRVRRALALANRQELHIKMVYGNTIPFIQHPFGEHFDCDAGYPAYDLKKARDLISAYGKPVRIECIHTNTSRGRAIGELLQALYKTIGVELRPVPLSTGPHVMRVLENKYDLATWRIPGAKDMGPQMFRSFYSASPTNYTGYSSTMMDDLLDSQRKEMDPGKRKTLLCKVARLINNDAVILYRGGRRRHIIARKKIRNITDVSGVSVNLATAWIDEDLNFNVLAYQIEQKAEMPFDCPDPGDVQSIKSIILGPWQGTDDWGGALQLRFTLDDKVIGSRSGGYNLSGSYMICGKTITWRAATGARLVLHLSENKLEGTFKKGAYGGTIMLEKAE